MSAPVHFHIYVGFTARDPNGTELPDYAAARRTALRMAGELIVEECREVKLGEEWRLEVTDEADLVLFRIDFNITESAAVLRANCRNRRHEELGYFGKWFSALLISCGLLAWSCIGPVPMKSEPMTSTPRKMNPIRT
ncbi:DUF6894 family protein [Methylobacterium brachythecii]|nr:hypothetical protein [Methylobacterium brachythecii]MBB3903258.1 hypothetical protein [Methylobacterium brachythecii]